MIILKFSFTWIFNFVSNNCPIIPLLQTYSVQNIVTIDTSISHNRNCREEKKILHPEQVYKKTTWSKYIV